jgi:hypothetical protein
MEGAKSHFEKKMAKKGCSSPIIDYFRNKLFDRELSVTWYFVTI